MAHNCHGNNKYLTVKPKNSRQKQKPQQKQKKLMAKAKSSRQNQKAHDKTKKLTAKPKLHGKPKSSRQKQKAHSKNKKSSRSRVLDTTCDVIAWVLGNKSNMAASSSKMFCSNCGAEAASTANFCARCGQGNIY